MVTSLTSLSVSLLVQALPLVLMVVIRVCCRSTLAKFFGVIGIALLSGSAAWYFAEVHAWRPRLRGGHVIDQSPEALFWMHGIGLLLGGLGVAFYKPGKAPEPPPAQREDSEPASPPAQTQTAKWTYWALVIFYGLALLPWPVFAFMGLFIFGDPRGDAFLNPLLAFSIWTYPLLFLFACWWGHYKRNPNPAMVALKMSLASLSMVWYFIVAGGTSLIKNAFDDPKKGGHSTDTSIRIPSPPSQ